MAETFLSSEGLTLDGQLFTSLGSPIGFSSKGNYTFTGTSYTIPNYSLEIHYIVTDNNGNFINNFSINSQGIINIPTSGTYFIYSFISDIFEGVTSI